MQSSIRRREFLGGALALGAAVPLGQLVTSAAVRGSPAQAGLETVQPWSMAMHIHSCFSEGTGSMEAQLDQAARNGVDVIWWTEHEFRMTASGARQVIGFNGMTESENNTKWTWKAASSGSLSERSASFVHDPTSASDPTGNSALRLAARSSSSTFATHRLDGSQYNSLFRANLWGTTLQLDVFPVSVSPDGYLAVYITTSYRPASGGQPAGSYTLEYRVGGDHAADSRVSSGRTATVALAAPSGGWTTVVLDPVQDMSALWPWFDARDSTLYGIGIGVGTRRGFRTDVVVDHLVFHRERTSPDDVIQLQQDLMAGYKPKFPTVTQHRGLEWSMLSQHVNWFGGNVTLPPPTAPPWVPDKSAAAMYAAVDRIHGSGGLASYNHPFGSGVGKLSSASSQDNLRRSKAAELLSARAYGCDVLEVGLPTKGGVSTDGYLALWDVLSRNGVFLTGTGVSDDHTGRNWLNQITNFLTWAWAETTGLGSLTAALAAGRVYFGNPAKFRGQLDLLVDGYVPMGGVSVEQSPRRNVRVIATDLPAGSSVDLVRGTVDYAGPTVTDPVTSKVSVPATSLVTGWHDFDVDTASDCFVRVVVRDSTGAVIAGSNPVWLLGATPATGIPVARRVGDSIDSPPKARFSWSAQGSRVQFDASASSSATTLASFAWDFDDGTTGHGRTVEHTFADGDYAILLTVTDDSGRSDTLVKQVTVATSPPPPASLKFVGAGRSNANTKLAKVTIPSTVAAGDGLVLFMTANTTQRPMANPAGWDQIGERIVGSQVTRALRRLATGGDAGATLQVPVSGGYAKVALEVMAYRGVSAGDFATAASDSQTKTATHLTPVTQVTAHGSWALSYWVDKSGGTTKSWTPPAGVTVRGTSYGSGGGALSTLSADSDTSVPIGDSGAEVALTNAVSSSATTWTVLIRP